MWRQIPRPRWLVIVLVIAGVALIAWIASLYVLHQRERMRPDGVPVKERPAVRP